jgi:hypothetical protein
MLEHRFKELVRSTSAVPALAGAGAMPMGCSFVPCPMFASMNAMQQSVIQEVYRRAAEIASTELAQFAPERSSRIPEFSIN